ncbi:MAG: hypothetical protein ABJK20_10380 [Halieaceae bacterium]
MNILKLSAQVAAISFGFGITMANATPSQGPADAVAVCQAIVQDNAAEVSRLLTDYRAPVEYSVASMGTSSASLRNARNVFECNGMDLDDFAGAVGAEKTSALFADADSTGKEYVAGNEAETADSQI